VHDTKSSWLTRLLTPHFLPALAESVHCENGGIDGVGTTFICCTRRPNDGVPDLAEALVRGHPEWTWRTIDAGHDVMVSAPGELAEMLLTIG
jgi:hypothetical protein